MLVVKVYTEEGKSEYRGWDFQGDLKIGYGFEIGGLGGRGLGGASATGEITANYKLI